MDAHRRLFTILFVSVFAAMLGLGIVAPLLPIYAENLGATGVWMGVIFSSFAFSRAVFMPIVGSLSDRHGRKPFIAVGLLAYTVLSLGYIWAPDILSLTIVRFLHGAASAMVVPIAMAYVGDMAKSGHEGGLMGRFQISLFLGMGSGPFLGGVLNDTFGFSSAFITMAVFTGIAFLIILVFLPTGRNGPALPSGTNGTPLCYLLHTPAVVGVLAFTLFNAVGRGGLMVFLPLYAPHVGVSPSETGILLTVNIFLIALLQAPFGDLADRMNQILLILLGSAVSSAALIALPHSGSFTILLAITAVIGIGSAIQQPSIMAMTVIAGKDHGMGSAMGIYNMAMSAGMILAPLLGGVIMDFIAIEWVFYAGGLIGIAGTSLFAAILRCAPAAAAVSAGDE